MELAGIVQEFNPYARALSEANQNGKITLEGAIKGEDTSIRKKSSFLSEVFSLLFSFKFFTSRVSVLKISSPFFEWYLVDPDLRVIFF